MDSPVFSRLADAIQAPTSAKEWYVFRCLTLLPFTKLTLLFLAVHRFSMAEQALNTVFTLGDQPDALCSEILRKMTTRVFAPKPAAAAEPTLAVEKQEDADESMAESAVDAVAKEEDTPTPIDVDEDGASSDSPLGNAFELSQLIFVAGHCSVTQLVHLELVERDLKRRKAEDDKAKLAVAGGKGKNAGDDELDQVAGSVEDEIGDAIHAAKETELLEGPQSLLAVFGPMAAEIVAKPKVYKVYLLPSSLTSSFAAYHPSDLQNSMLQTAATLALSKFMCISSKFCDAHLNLLFKVLETSREPAVRSNIVIALGDIAVSFSTIMDEKSDELYAGLHDKDATVKKNTLMVLTHLILNGMIKVKGQLGEMAKCLSDEDKRIKDLAHLFFEELATKDKAIYNNLPDIISHLSTGHNPVDEDTFQTSMRFIFKFVDKVRHPSFSPSLKWY
jgi:condensin complex subunit 1